MPTTKSLTSKAPWVELVATDHDWKVADPLRLGTLLVCMNVIRTFEETVLELAAKGMVHGPAHSSIGQEAGAAGSVVGLLSGDQVNGSHRGHHQFLAKALMHLSPGELDPTQPVSANVRDMLKRTLAEILGLHLAFVRAVAVQCICSGLRREL